MKFFLSSNFNIKGKGDGQAFARRLVPRLEALTRDRCISRWMYSEWHLPSELRHGDSLRLDAGKTIAVTDITDLSTADYLIAVPVTHTARGAHVEIGFALARDIPVYLYRPDDGVSPTGFDTLCQPFPDAWKDAVRDALNPTRRGKKK